MDLNSLIKRLILTALISAAAINTGFSVNPADMFPKMEGWELNRGEMVYTPENLWDIINGAADAYLSYDFQKLYTAEYADDQERRIRVYIFEHSNPVNAFGIYSQERSIDYEFNYTGAQGFKSGDAYYFISGPFYIQLTASGNEMNKPLEFLAQLIAKGLNQENKLPVELALFPDKGKVSKTEKYIASSFLGYSFLHSAFTANYQNEGSSFQIFIISPENSEMTAEILSNYLDLVKIRASKRDKKDFFKIEDPYNGPVLLYKNGKYLYGILNADHKTQKEYLKLLRNKFE